MHRLGTFTLRLGTFTCYFLFLFFFLFFLSVCSPKFAEIGERGHWWSKMRIQLALLVLAMTCALVLVVLGRSERSELMGLDRFEDVQV
jgi:hypothetical protein